MLELNVLNGCTSPNGAIGCKTQPRGIQDFCMSAADEGIALIVILMYSGGHCASASGLYEASSCRNIAHS